MTNKNKLVCFIAVLICIGLFVNGYGHSKKHPSEHGNIHAEKCRLTIDESHIGKPYPRTIFGKKCYVSDIPVKLVNLTADTLVYQSFSCSWDEIFTTDDADIKRWPSPCEYNVPKVKILMPRQTQLFSLPVYWDATLAHVNDKLKIGMHFQEPIPDDPITTFYAKLLGSKNLIWSAPVRISEGRASSQIVKN